MKPYEERRHDLALHYGTELPKPPKLKLSLPAFVVGSCSTMQFSPSGEQLLVPTNNGCFLWDVATGKKRLRLRGPSNPTTFSFSSDGSELLMRNERAQFARFLVSSGEQLVKFTAQYEYRVDGQGCLGRFTRERGHPNAGRVSAAGSLMQLAAAGGADCKSILLVRFQRQSAFNCRNDPAQQSI